MERFPKGSLWGGATAGNQYDGPTNRCGRTFAK